MSILSGRTVRGPSVRVMQSMERSEIGITQENQNDDNLNRMELSQNYINKHLSKLWQGRKKDQGAST